jgi:hypothetical protein
MENCLRSDFFSPGEAQRKGIYENPTMKMKILSFFKVCKSHFPHCFHQFIGQFDGRGFVVKVLLNPDGLKAEIVDNYGAFLPLQEKPGEHGFQEHILYDVDHFSEHALLALKVGSSSIAINLTKAECTSLLVVAMYLHDLTNLSNRLVHCTKIIVQDQLHKQAFQIFSQMMIDDFIEPDFKRHKDSQHVRSRWKQCSKLKHCTIEAFIRCVHHAAILSKYHKAKMTDIAKEFIDKFGCNLGIATLFQTVAYHFRNQQTNDSMETLCKILSELQELNGDNCNILLRLIEKYRSISTNQNELSLFFVSFEWCQKVLKENDRTVGTTLILQPGTSSSNATAKHYLYAMMAIIFVKALGKKVHILFNNGTNLKNMVDETKELFHLFSIIHCEDFVDVKNLAQLSFTTDVGSLDEIKRRQQFSAFGVTYCHVGNLEWFYHDELKAGVKNPFEDTILIIPSLNSTDTNNQPLNTVDQHYRAPFVFTKYDCVIAVCEGLQSSNYCDENLNATFFNVGTFMNPRQDVESNSWLEMGRNRAITSNSFIPEPLQFAMRLQLGGRMHRLHDAFITQQSRHLRNREQGAYLKSVLNDRAIDALKLDSAFQELSLEEV